MQYVNFTDPRLGIRPATAQIDGALTVTAVRLLTDVTLAGTQGVICGPSLGIAVRVMRIVGPDTDTILLNPVLVEAGDLRMTYAETTPYTGKLCRNVVRAHSVTVSGFDLSNRFQELPLTGTNAIEAQHCFELLNQPRPFDWITPFHHRLVTQTEAAVRVGFETVMQALHAARPATTGADQMPPLVLADRSLVNVHADRGGACLGSIDALNPQQPISANDRMVLAALLAFTGAKRVFFTDPFKLGLMLANKLVLPEMSARLLADQSAWPATATASLGLGGSVSRHAVDLAALPKDFPTCDAIIWDQTAMPQRALPDTAALYPVARALDGAQGAFIALLPAADPDFEVRLKTVFPDIYRITLPAQQALYIAVKTPRDAAGTRGRLMGFVTGFGLDALSGFLTLPWHFLGKDGREDLV